MSKLGDDELGLILNWITDLNDRRSFSEACKQWLRVEGLNRSSLRLLEPDALLQVLPRFPNLVTFETSKFITDADLSFLAQTCPKIEVINLSLKTPREISYQFDEVLIFDNVGDEGLCALAKGCPKLSKVLLRRRKNIGNFGVVSLLNLAHNLTYLDLGFCSLVSDQALEAIGSANSITVLSLQGCSLITDRGLGFLANGSSSKTMKRLNLAECDRITDFGVSLLEQMFCLLELNLAECGPKVTDIGGLSIAAIQSLKRLNLSWLVNVSDHTLVALAENCLNLEMVDLTGCDLVTGAGIRAFAGHKCLEALVLRSCFNVSDSDVVHTVLRCQFLKSVVLDRGLRIWMLPQTQESISRFAELVWA
ncbi:PREDICTED: F-box/LRR-repeat protein 4-like [Prunus mume]|uniref:F-box/LRR-repeat protein 4-like n=1 Tax=Prunus mume TaxID=102107 RepID=A0ABM1LHI4_PRUMU|nr:PREDICTED: F-box/LRR-repeat protein 4-like [Prunus mume]